MGESGGGGVDVTEDEFRKRGKMRKLICSSLEQPVCLGRGFVAYIPIGPPIGVANVYCFAAAEIAKRYPYSSGGKGVAENVSVRVRLSGKSVLANGSGQTRGRFRVFRARAGDVDFPARGGKGGFDALDFGVLK